MTEQLVILKYLSPFADSPVFIVCSCHCPEKLPTLLMATGERREGFDVVVAAAGTSAQLPFQPQLLTGQASQQDWRREGMPLPSSPIVHCPPGW